MMLMVSCAGCFCSVSIKSKLLCVQLTRGMDSPVSKSIPTSSNTVSGRTQVCRTLASSIDDPCPGSIRNLNQMLAARRIRQYRLSAITIHTLHDSITLKLCSVDCISIPASTITMNEPRLDGKDVQAFLIVDTHKPAFMLSAITSPGTLRP